MITVRYHLGALADPTEAIVQEYLAASAAERVWAKDHTLWSADPTEISNRLGWLDSPQESLSAWDELVEFAAEIAGEVDDIVLMGMGGSSLFPEVLHQTFASAEGYPHLHVLDSTDADAVRRVVQATDPERTLHLVSSKSGSTIETRSQLDLFWERSGDPRRFCVITDAGSELDALAAERGLRRVFHNNPDIGGRFSALSLFGMVPAALIDVDGEAVLESALDMADALEPTGSSSTDDNVGVRLAAVFAASVAAGRPVMTLAIEPGVESFGLWLEQLVAESTGKAGTGLIPAVGEEIDTICDTAEHRLVVMIGRPADRERLMECGAPVVELGLEELTDLGAQVLLWEYAVALSSRTLGLNPFDQPDVESAKIAARTLLDGGSPTPTPLWSVQQARSAVNAGDCVAVCAFVDPDSELAGSVAEFRHRIGREWRVATTLGFGPRFLHSTGQLHKGGPDTIVVIQVVSEEPVHGELSIPGRDYGFGALKVAQAAGDLAALESSGHRAFRVDLDGAAT